MERLSEGASCFQQKVPQPPTAMPPEIEYYFPRIETKYRYQEYQWNEISYLSPLYPYFCSCDYASSSYLHWLSVRERLLQVFGELLDSGAKVLGRRATVHGDHFYSGSGALSVFSANGCPAHFWRSARSAGLSLFFVIFLHYMWQ